MLPRSNCQSLGCGGKLSALILAYCLLLYLQTGNCVININHHNHAVTAAAWAPDGKSFVTGSHDKQSQLCSWTPEGQQNYSWKDVDHRIQGCVISPDGQRMVTISAETEITVYNYMTHMFEYQIKVASKMTCINISRDSRYVLVNMADNEVQLFDLETADIVRRFMGQKQGEFVLRSAFGGADQNLIISGSEGMLYHHVIPRIAILKGSRFESVYLA